jgi:AmmeMemoRadiSam system protein A
MCPQPDNPPASVLEQFQEYSPPERALLLRFAHAAIAAGLHERVPDFTPPLPHLAEKRGAFTTLHLHSQLRGCVGYVFAQDSLYRTVGETAIAAAFYDARFWPVTREEVPDLKVEISVLSAVEPITPEQVEIGRHGLLVSQNGRRGLLLPQVPVEHGWDLITFLQQTCQKAGLPPYAWEQGALLEAFTAEVFGEPVVPALLDGKEQHSA